jgi:hypothetical protein
MLFGCPYFLNKIRSPTESENSGEICGVFKSISIKIWK